jgi:hypothetical protein
VLASAVLLVAGPAGAAILIPMDLTQTDHLKSYGVAYWALEKGYRVEWLLNYRGGSFIVLDGGNDVIAECRYRGVVWEEPGGADLANAYRTIEEENMEVVLLEKAPAVALYAPDNIQPWDDAVMLALEYAEIPYTVVWDREVLAGGLEQYDWLHLHHEDFTGQYGKFHASFQNAEWYKKQKIYYEKLAGEQGFPSVSEHKKASARAIKEYVRRGGFLFSMCSGTDSYDVALSAEGVDVVDVAFDGDPPDPGYQDRIDYSKSLAFHGFSLIEPERLRVLGHRHDRDREAEAGGDRLLHALRVRGEARSGAGDADAVPRRRRQGLHGADHELSAEPHQDSRDDARGLPGHRGGQIHPREPRARHVHVPRGPRPRGLPPHGRRPADDPLDAQELTGLPPDPQQHPVPCGEEEGEEDVGPRWGLTGPPRGATIIL